MLVTAQRVQSTRSRKEGVNALLFHHGAESTARIDWDRPDVDEVVRRDPGEIIAESIEVAPGGNLVESFLDILCPDESPVAEILGACASAAAVGYAEKSAGDSFRSAKVSLRFYPGRTPVPNRAAEFGALVEQIADLLAHPVPAAWHQRKALVVRETATENGWKFQLDEPSLMRVRELLGSAWVPPVVATSSEFRSEFAALDGDLLPQVLPTLVGLSPERALAMGGVVVLDSKGSLLRAWPAQVAARGQSLQQR